MFYLLLFIVNPLGHRNSRRFLGGTTSAPFAQDKRDDLIHSNAILDLSENCRAIASVKQQEK